LAGRRRAFTLTETMVALGVLGAILLVVAQLGYTTLRERRRNAARQEALEAAANVLEAARVCSWEELTPAWADQQRLPDSTTRHLRDARLQVRVEPEAPLPHTRRITVELRWSLDNDIPARPVRLVGLRSARSAQASGGER
jgi:prepilin-type N-terminal cleavage/methylation domain-containing protein